jgi:glycosyltransferase involved in cell wall biosynthesis
MKISVVIPTYNEEINIGKCIKSLLKQTIPKKDYEIIVVDGGSRDNTKKISRQLGAKFIKQRSKGVGGARNNGAFMAKGDIIACTDADTILPANWLETILDNFKKDIVCVFGVLKPIKNTWFYKIAFYLGNKIVYTLSRTNVFHNVCGANSAFRKKEFLKINGFDPAITASDDIEIALRLKKYGRIYFDKELTAYCSTRRIEKFGLMKMLPLWFMNSFNVVRNKPRKVEYARQDYAGLH